MPKDTRHLVRVRVWVRDRVRVRVRVTVFRNIDREACAGIIGVGSRSDPTPMVRHMLRAEG